MSVVGVTAALSLRHGCAVFKSFRLRQDGIGLLAVGHGWSAVIAVRIRLRAVYSRLRAYLRSREVAAVVVNYTITEVAAIHGFCTGRHGCGISSGSSTGVIPFMCPIPCANHA